ncbi:MAG: ABC transporter permease [Planctomycetes bacterium]|nr:ABC transporter permease [Planctomycetota bacterium]
MSRFGPIFAVASLAFRESARNRVLHALLLALVAACGVSFLFAWAAGGDGTPRPTKIVGDLTLSAVIFLGTIASIFLGTNLVFQEIERRTVFSVLARPISRGGFVLGKFLGLAGVMAVALSLMSVVFLVSYGLAGGSVSLHLICALFLIYVELLVVIAVALFFSVAAHPIEGAVFSFVVAIMGHQTSSLKDLGATVLQRAGEDAGLVATATDKFLYVLYVVLPNLERFNLRGTAIYGFDLPWAQVGWSLIYATVYIAIVLSLATLVFRRKVL